MPADSLTGQLHRIGPLAAVCVVLALALGTFALLKRIISTPARTPAPTTVAPPRTRLEVPPASPNAAAATGGSSDPLAAAQAQTLKGLTRIQQQQGELARKQAAIFRRQLAALNHRNAAIGTFQVPHPAATQSAAPSPVRSPQKKATTTPARPTGGAPVQRR